MQALRFDFAGAGPVLAETGDEIDKVVDSIIEDTGAFKPATVGFDMGWNYEGEDHGPPAVISLCWPSPQGFKAAVLHVAKVKDRMTEKLKQWLLDGWVRKVSSLSPKGPVIPINCGLNVKL